MNDASRRDGTLDTLRLLPKFSGAARAQKQKNKIAESSVIAAQQKEKRLLSFYEDPYGNGTEQWYLAPILWKYEREFKFEGKKRKDKATEDIIHELDPSLFAATLFRCGFLPPAVTYQRYRKKKFPIPLEQQSIENLFCTFPIHDRDEDDPDASRDTLIEFANDHISDIPEISDRERDLLRLRADFMGDVSDAITFGRKTRNKKGDIVEVETHGNNLPTYSKAMREIWPAISTKALDRLGGTITRFTRVPVKNFSPKKTMAYLNETRLLFMAGQPLEDMIERYPQLSAYFDLVNINLRIAIVCVDSMIQVHPKLDPKHFPIRGTRDPETVEVTIHRYLRKAMQAAPWTTKDICPITCLIDGMVAEADRYPELRPIPDQVLQQATPYLMLLESGLKNGKLPHRGPNLP